MSHNDKVNILLVDDQPSKLLSYQAILAELNQNLIAAGSGREALVHLMNTEIAVVLVDVCMPDIDGFELATLIREHPRFKNTAIILVSAVAVSDLDRLRGYDSGAVDYVPVPIVPEVLRAKVAIFIELYRNREELRALNADLESRVAERTAELEASSARLRESEERLRMALAAGRLGTWDLDLVTGAIRTTDVCNANLGVPPGVAFNSENLFARIYAPDRGAFREALQESLDTRADFEVECRVIWPDDSIRWLIMRGRPVCDDQNVPLRVQGVTLDITERRRIEEERLLLLDSERAARLEAERAGRAKDEFLAMLSHELRSPLGVVMGWVRVMRDNEENASTVKQGLEIMERNVRAQARLIDDLLDLNRIASGKFHVEQCEMDLAATVNAAVESLLPAADAKGLQISRDIGNDLPRFGGDAVRLQQVVANLLANAVKYTPRGGQIIVALRRVDAFAELQITDTGEGIAEQFLPHIFDRFRQADSSITRQHGGLGLGLSIAKHLVELHGGTLVAHSAGKGCGSTFVVRLPIGSDGRAQSHDPQPADNWAEPDLTGARLLVVDDDADACGMLERLLADRGAQVDSVRSVDAALEQISATDYDVLISDVGMPSRDGYELMRCIRQLKTSARTIPSIAVTAFARPEDRSRALDAGFDRYLAKPINPRELFQIVFDLLHLEQAPLREPSPTPARLQAQK